MSFRSHGRALRFIAKDKLRGFVGLHGANALRLPRFAAGVLAPRLTFLNLLMQEHRLSLDDRATELVKRHLPEIMSHLDDLVLPADPHMAPTDDEFRAIVLRAPQWHAGQMRKGVLLIKFGETFRFFYHHVDIPRLMRMFRIVLEPSWSGYCLPEILLWTRYQDPVVVQASEVLDRRFLEALDSNLVPIEIGASDWVDHRVFRPLGIPKQYDAIYVANLTPIKRVNVYLRAISQIVRVRPQFRAAIALSSWGGDQQTFEDLLAYYGVRDHLKVFMRVPQAELNTLVNQSRVSVLLSRKEGSNKTLFESLFADTPGILLQNNIGVNKEYINAHTGALIEERDLAAAMLEFAGENGRKLHPRAWAMANIAPEHSARKLQAVLARFETGPEASMPLLPKVNNPEANYMDEDVASLMPNIAAVMRIFLKTQTASSSEAQTIACLQQLFSRWNEQSQSGTARATV